MARSLPPSTAWLAAAALILLAPTPAAAQTHACGDIQLVFRNPDLQPAADGFIHAQGQFFAQFQAIGPGADAIKVFGFSFGPQTADVDESVCALPAWPTGAYIPNYRADRDPTDGFFIPLKTPLVPDGTYAAAVHAYDGNNNELARFWAKAIVDNCDTASNPAQEKCDGDLAQMTRHDKTAPWPIVLPGDGQALEGRTFTVEFAEPVSKLLVTLNGNDISHEMVKWDGRLWDADYVPDYGPGGASAAVAAPCTQAYQTCERYGPAYEWKGRPVQASDVFRVEATDVAGNVAVKDIHIGSSVDGGAVTQDVPILSYTVDATSKPARTDQAAVFAFTITNNGAGEGHPFAEAAVPEGWTYEWQPVHVVVAPGATARQELVVTPAAAAPSGTYKVNATLTYNAGGESKVLAEHLTVELAGASALAATTTTEAAAKATPAFAPLALATLLLAGARWRRC